MTNAPDFRERMQSLSVTPVERTDRGFVVQMHADDFDMLRGCIDELAAALDEATQWMYHAGGCDIPVEGPNCDCGRNKHFHAAHAVLTKWGLTDAT